jgi:hypothetical protein
MQSSNSASAAQRLDVCVDELDLPQAATLGLAAGAGQHHRRDVDRHVADRLLGDQAAECEAASAGHVEILLPSGTAPRRANWRNRRPASVLQSSAAKTLARRSRSTTWS